MAVTMRASGKPLFLTEADLVSPCQDKTSQLFTKDLAFDPTHPESNGINFPLRVQQSLTQFIQAEAWARAVMTWLLVNQFTGTDTCDANTEINWHKAYGEDGVMRTWFALWWPITP